MPRCSLSESGQVDGAVPDATGTATSNCICPFAVSATEAGVPPTATVAATATCICPPPSLRRSLPCHPRWPPPHSRTRTRASARTWAIRPPSAGLPTAAVGRHAALRGPLSSADDGARPAVLRRAPGRLRRRDVPSWQRCMRRPVLGPPLGPGPCRTVTPPLFLLHQVGAASGRTASAMTSCAWDAAADGAMPRARGRAVAASQAQEVHGAWQYDPTQAPTWCSKNKGGVTVRHGRAEG